MIKGKRILISLGGTYEPIRLDADASGTEDSPTVIEGDAVLRGVINAMGRIHRL